MLGEAISDAHEQLFDPAALSLVEAARALSYDVLFTVNSVSGSFPCNFVPSSVLDSLATLVKITLESTMLLAHFIFHVKSGQIPYHVIKIYPSSKPLFWKMAWDCMLISLKNHDLEPNVILLWRSAAFIPQKLE